jgi:hypothetical protein
MTREELKNFINTNCMTKKGRPGFNNRASIYKWWENNNYEKQLNCILDETSFYTINNISTRCWFICNDIYSTPKCTVCNNPTNFRNFAAGFYRICSKECVTKDEERNKKIPLNRNYEEINEKIKKTNIKKYGVEHSFQHKEVIEKSKKTKFERYGNELYNNIDKNKETCLEKYGSPYWFASETGKNQLKDLIASRGGSLKLPVELNMVINDIDYLMELNETMSIIEIGEKLNVSPITINTKFVLNGIEPKKYPNRNCLLQNKLYEDIKQIYFDEIICNDRKLIAPKEIDIYIPKINLGIELNGLYWHSESFGENLKMKHKNKLDQCKSIGIELIQITDKEYFEKKNLVINLISTKLGLNKKIYARNCVIKKVDTKNSKDFLEQYHFQGNIPSSIKYGLYHCDELVSLMSFGISRFNKKYQYELLRYCVKSNITIIGGAQKLFSAFVREVDPKSIVSYCDISKFNGNIYETLGFKFSHTSQPNYVYIKGREILSRYQSQKHKLKKLLDNYNNELSESDNMFNNNYKRYWDCGMNVYVWEQ